MDDDALDRLGPVDYLVVEFPVGTQNFTGEVAEQLIKLHDSGSDPDHGRGHPRQG